MAQIRQTFYSWHSTWHTAVHIPLVALVHADARELIANLTKREHEVMRLACDGMRNKEIADTLNLGVRTVESYRHQAIQKLGESKLINIAKIFQAAQGS